MIIFSIFVVYNIKINWIEWKGRKTEIIESTRKVSNIDEN